MKTAIQLSSTLKKSALLFSIILFVFSTISSCRKDNEPPPAISVDKTKIESLHTEDTVVEISVTANRHWSLQIPEEAITWISADVKSGEGNGKIRLSITQASLQPRSAVITFQSLDQTFTGFTVTQVGYINKELQFANSEVRAMVEGADAYYLAGTQNEKMMLRKISKTDLSIINQKIIEFPGGEKGCIEAIAINPGGGFYIAGTKSINDSRDIYLAKMNNNLELSFEHTIDKESETDNLLALIPLGNDVIIAGTAGPDNFLEKHNGNDLSLIRSVTTDKIIYDIKPLAVDKFVAAGKAGDHPYLGIYNDALGLVQGSYNSSKIAEFRSIVITADGFMAAGSSKDDNNNNQYYVTKFDDELIQEDVELNLMKGVDCSLNMIVPLGRHFVLGGSYKDETGKIIGNAIRADKALTLSSRKELSFTNGLTEITTVLMLPDNRYLLAGKGNKLVLVNP